MRATAAAAGPQAIRKAWGAMASGSGDGISKIHKFIVSFSASLSKFHVKNLARTCQGTLLQQWEWHDTGYHHFAVQSW